MHGQCRTSVREQTVQLDTVVHGLCLFAARRTSIRPTQRDDEDTLTQAIVTLASQYGRYGYRRITALLQRAGWQVGKDRVERIWRREGLKVPQRQNGEPADD
jgi:transposase InsO family protein